MKARILSAVDEEDGQMKFNALELTNIVNRCKLGGQPAGVQLELSKSVRVDLEKNPTKRSKVTHAIRSRILTYISNFKLSK